MITTTAINACDAVLRLDNEAGNLVDISGSSNSVEIDLNNDVGEFKVFGSPWKGRLPCGKDASIKIKVVYTMAQAEAMRIMLDWFFNSRGNKTIQIDLPDSTTGSDRYQAECVLESFNIPSPADDANPVMAEINLMPDGAITWATI